MQQSCQRSQSWGERFMKPTSNAILATGCPRLCSHSAPLHLVLTRVLCEVHFLWNAVHWAEVLQCPLVSYHARHAHYAALVATLKRVLKGGCAHKLKHLQDRTICKCVCSVCQFCQFCLSVQIVSSSRYQWASTVRILARSRQTESLKTSGHGDCSLSCIISRFTAGKH